MMMMINIINFKKNRNIRVIISPSWIYEALSPEITGMYPSSRRQRPQNVRQVRTSNRQSDP